MNRSAAWLITSLFLGAACSCPGEEAKLSLLYTGKVSSLSLPGSELGEHWTGPSLSGLVVDDFKDLSSFADRARPLVEEMKKLVTPHGVVASADFTYRKNTNPPEQVTLRVFVFNTEDSCRKWWTKRYRYDGWEKHYTAVAEVPYDASDSKEMSKRAVAFGNIWMTCGTIDKTKDYIKVLDLYINKIKNVTERK
jgi:hypothetical protein